MGEEVIELRVPRREHGLLAVSLIATSVALILISVAVIVALRRPTPWAPLELYADQTVSSRVDGVDGPAVRVDEPLVVTGTKCVKADVTVRGSSFWQSVDIPGTFIPGGSGVADLKAGCTTKTFINPLPAGVIASAATGPRRWILSGTETPVRPNGKSEGVPRTWRSEEFEVVP